MGFYVTHSGVDTLEVSFKGYLPPCHVEALEGARLEARKDHRPKLIELVPGLAMQVGESGLKGGYTYTCDTGPEGELWWFKSASSMDWNIRVKVKAANLAARGWNGVKEKLYVTMAMLGIQPVEESIARVDFALDFTVPEDFQINPYAMVAHSHSTMGEKGIQLEQFGEWSVYTAGRRTESVTIGKMPGRQLIVYDKSQEIKDNKKDYWWQFLNVEPGTRVYRVECRFGKKFLKEKCGVSTWEEVETHLPALCVDILQSVRMCSPKGDTNASRWPNHPMWDEALRYLTEKFDNAWAGRPNRVITGERDRMAGIFNQQLRGSLVSFAQIAGVEEADFGRFLQAVAEDVADWQGQCGDEFARKWEKSGDKYRFLTGEWEI